MPKVSVVIPCYNVEKYLRQCLDSVVNQILQDIEIICINDGSTDSTLEILREYENNDNRVKVIDKENSGYGASMNIGLDNATGEYIGIVEPDDYIDSKMYKDLYNIGKEFDSDIVKSGFYDNLQDKEEQRIIKVKWDDDKIPQNKSFIISECPLFFSYHPSVWSCIYKKEFIKEKNIRFIEAPGAGWTDNPFQVQTLCLAKKINYTPEAYYYWRRLNKDDALDLHDYTIPFKRSDEIHNWLQKIDVKSNILECLYFRELYYIKLVFRMQNVPNIDDCLNRVSNMVKRMDSMVIMNSSLISAKNKRFYNRLLRYRYLAYLYEKNIIIKRFIKKIFSVKNENSHKIIKILGIKLKFRRCIPSQKTNYTGIKNNEKRLLYVASDNYKFSGAFLCMVELCKSIKKYNINPLIVIPYEGSGTSLLEEYNLDYILIKQEDWVVPTNITFLDKIKKFKKSIKNINAIFSLIRIINKYNIDIVHLNTIWTYTAAISALLTKKTLIWHIREVLTKGENTTLLFGDMSYKLINKANKIICISNAVKNEYSLFNANKTKVIYDGLPFKKFYCPDRCILNDDLISIVCVGNLHLHKGQLKLLESLNLLNRTSYQNWHITFVGEGNIYLHKEFVNKYKLNDKVTFAGHTKNTYEYYTNCDISIIPSQFEGFSRVTAESMLAGCMVIASNTGAIPELIQDNVNGLLFNRENPEDICNKIIWAFTHIEECRQMARFGQEKASKIYTTDRNTQGIYETYLELLNRKENNNE